jgi:hypothetical protein
LAVGALTPWEALQLATLAAVGLVMGGSTNKHKVNWLKSLTLLNMSEHRYLCLSQAMLEKKAARVSYMPDSTAFSLKLKPHCIPHQC